MKNLITLFALLLTLSFATSVKAQDYKSAIGLRLGYPYAISYKTFVSKPAAVEIFLGGGGYLTYGGFNIGALYQIHKPIQGVEGLKWYYGGGASAFVFSKSASLGILGNLGLDYKITNAPINFSLDWVPAFLIGRYNGFGGGFGALSVRYTLK